MRKGKQKPGTATKAHRVNLERITIPSGNVGELPADLPMKMVVDRVFGIYEDDRITDLDVNGLLGHVVGLDFYNKGVGAGTYIEINVYRDPNALKIEVNGEEKWRWVEDKSELPMRTSEVITEQRRVDSEWVDQVDLQPGDEVLGGNVIVRADVNDPSVNGQRKDAVDRWMSDDDEELFPEEVDDEIIWD